MSESCDGLQSPTSSATFNSSDGDVAGVDAVEPWEVELPQIEPADDYEAIVDCLTEWSYGEAFAFVKERSWQNKAGATWKVKLMCDRACAASLGPGWRSIQRQRQHLQSRLN